jgi:hypothetical protein
MWDGRENLSLARSMTSPARSTECLVFSVTCVVDFGGCDVFDRIHRVQTRGGSSELRDSIS